MNITDPSSLIQTMEYEGETYIISQVRICRNCRDTLQITDGNHRLYFDKENHIALHEHIKCPSRGYYSTGEAGSRIISAKDKLDFLYPNRKKY